MIVIAGMIRIDPARRDAAVAAALEIMTETQKEEGCISYAFSADLADPGCFRIFEEWKSPEALAAHFTTPHMARFQSVIPSLGVRDVKIQRYEVSSVGPLA
jgi:quinol monooxygenase YgiN